MDKDTLIITNSTGIVDAGTEINRFKEYDIVDSEVGSVLINYDITFEYGTLTVYRRPIAVTSASAEKHYDGTPLTNKQCIITEDSPYGLVPGHSIVATVTGSRTDIGVSPNTYDRRSVKIFDGETDISYNYDIIRYDVGTLEVKKPSDSDSGEIIDAVFAKICTGKTGYVYLRMNSYGDLKGQTWLDAKDYGHILPDGSNYNYLTSYALKNYGAETDYMVVTENKIYFLPYFPTVNGSYEVPQSDTSYNSDMNGYELEYFMLPIDFDYRELEGMLEDYSKYEKDYRKFVHENYLNVDTATFNYMMKIINANGFDPNDPEIISKVAEYIKGSAEYNLEYDPQLDKVSNMVVSFLNKYKEGKCTHFAASATMMFRTLGIPARYVEGFAVSVKAGEETEVKNPGHAWVEVYFDGIGWIPVEVTPGTGDSEGGGPGGEGPGGEGPGGGDLGEGEEKRLIDVTPKFVYKDYDGEYLYAVNEIEYNESIDWLVKNGYSYSVKVSGKQLEIGSSASKIESFVIFDSDGKDVTDELFEVTYNEGVVRVNGSSIILYLYQLQKYYDGTPLKYENEDYEIIDMPDGFSLELEINISMTDVGFLTLDDINANIEDYIKYTVFDSVGTDVSKNFSIVFDTFGGSDKVYVPMRIDKWQLELTTASETKEYEIDMILRNEEVYISKGSLLKGHTLHAVAIGEISYIGSVDNDVDLSNLMILDESGRDVTDNYDITVILGILTLTDPDAK